MKALGSVVWMALVATLAVAPRAQAQEVQARLGTLLSRIVRAGLPVGATAASRYGITVIANRAPDYSGALRELRAGFVASSAGARGSAGTRIECCSAALGLPNGRVPVLLAVQAPIGQLGSVLRGGALCTAHLLVPCGRHGIPQGEPPGAGSRFRARRDRFRRMRQYRYGTSRQVCAR